MTLKYFENLVKKSSLYKKLKQGLTNEECKKILNILLTPKGLNALLKFNIALIREQQIKNQKEN